MQASAVFRSALSRKYVGMYVVQHDIDNEKKEVKKKKKTANDQNIKF